MASISNAAPQFLVAKLDDALAFYVERLGFHCDFVYAHFYASVSRDNATIHLDYVDVVALAERLGAGAARVLVEMDNYYEDEIGPGGRRVATQLVKQLADPAPYDLSEVDLSRYRKLRGPWREWDNVVTTARGLAGDVLDLPAERR